jgi:hypothetical protein
LARALANASHFCGQADYRAEVEIKAANEKRLEALRAMLASGDQEVTIA